MKKAGWARERILPKFSNKDGGFNLIEVILAMLILTLAILSIAELFVLSARVNNTARDSTTAAAIAAEKMEELKRASYSSLTAGGSLAIASPEEGFYETSDSGFITLWKIEDDTPAADMKKISVKASLTLDSRSRVGGRNVVLVTYRANDE